MLIIVKRSEPVNKKSLFSCGKERENSEKWAEKRLFVFCVLRKGQFLSILRNREKRWRMGKHGLGWFYYIAYHILVHILIYPDHRRWLVPHLRLAAAYFFYGGQLSRWHADQWSDGIIMRTGVFLLQSGNG